MKSPRHPVMQAAEPFSDPAGTHCAGVTDGANVSDDASLHHRAVWSTNGPLWLGQVACHAHHEYDKRGESPGKGKRDYSFLHDAFKQTGTGIECVVCGPGPGGFSLLGTTLIHPTERCDN